MKSKIFCALSLLLFGISFISAQQSCYEQYLRAHNMPLPTDSMTVDDSYDELKKEVIARQLMRNERTFVSQPIRQPLLLVIDTLAGTCHLLAQDGTILADVHLAMVDSTWYMWLSVDPLADKYPGNTPYLYCNGNPIMFIDPDGRYAEVKDNGDCTYTVEGGEVDDDLNIYIVKDGERTGEVLGQMLTPYSFFNDNEKIVKGAIIDMKDTSGQEFLNQKTTDAQFPVIYAVLAYNGFPNDFKDREMPEEMKNGNPIVYRYRGMPVNLWNGEGCRIASARDVGNVGAGYVAGCTGNSWITIRGMFNLVQGKFKRKVPEANVSQEAQWIGYQLGYKRIGQYVCK